MSPLHINDDVLWEDGYVLRRENDHVLRSALDIEVEGQRKKVRPEWKWEKQVEEESTKVCLSREN